MQIGPYIVELADAILKCQKDNYIDDMERRLKLRLSWAHKQ